MSDRQIDLPKLVSEFRCKLLAWKIATLLSVVGLLVFSVFVVIAFQRGWEGDMQALMIVALIGGLIGLFVAYGGFQRPKKKSSRRGEKSGLSKANIPTRHFKFQG